MRLTLFITFTLALFTGCSQPEAKPPLPVALPVKENPTTIVLLDNDRDQNAIVVSTDHENVLVDTPNHFVTLKDKETKPTQPEIMDADTLNALFGETLEALPKSPQKYVLYFDRNAAELTPQSIIALEAITEAIKEREPCDLALIGYTDTKGSVQYNRELSRRRVDNTLTWIRNHPLKLRNITKKYQGEEALEIETGDETLEPKNRRVELFIR